MKKLFLICILSMSSFGLSISASQEPELYMEVCWTNSCGMSYCYAYPLGTPREVIMIDMQLSELDCVEQVEPDVPQAE